MYFMLRIAVNGRHLVTNVFSNFTVNVWCPYSNILLKISIEDLNSPTAHKEGLSQETVISKVSVL
jgi:hypothetical protein